MTQVVVRPKVLIVGAGLGGLTLAILLQKAGVEFDIFERAQEVKPLGSAISLIANINPIFRQMGIWEEFVDLALTYEGIQVFNENLEPEFTMDITPGKELSGADNYIITRPVLYDLLLRQIPSERIHMGKRVLSMLQNDNGVMIRTADGSTYDGDILVGADGAYSAVRQCIYKDLKDMRILPSSDGVALPYSCVSVLGQTLPMTEEEFPPLGKDTSQFFTVLGEDKPYSWRVFTTKEKTLCWSVIQHLDKVSSKENDSFRNSEWGTEAAEAMCKEVKDFAIPGGKGPLTIGDLIERTPKHLISKVMLEEKVFDTWYFDRTVLIGDACHKVNPSGGAGASNAFQDAVALANWISTLESTSLKGVTHIFEEYKAERFPQAKASFDKSQLFSKMIAKSFSAKIVRYMTKNMPWFLWLKVVTGMVANRPQVSFLPLVKDHGTSPPTPQPSLIKTLKIIQDRQRERAAAV